MNSRRISAALLCGIGAVVVGGAALRFPGAGRSYAIFAAFPMLIPLLVVILAESAAQLVACNRVSVLSVLFGLFAYFHDWSGGGDLSDYSVGSFPVMHSYAVLGMLVASLAGISVRRRHNGEV